MCALACPWRMCQCLSLSLDPSVACVRSLSLPLSSCYLSLCLSLCLPFCLCLSVFLSLSLSVCLSLSLSLALLISPTDTHTHTTETSALDTESVDQAPQRVCLSCLYPSALYVNYDARGLEQAHALPLPETPKADI